MFLTYFIHPHNIANIKKCKMCTKIQTYILKSVLNSSSCLQRENKPPSNFNALLLPTRTQKHHNSIILKTSHNEPVARAHLLNMQPQYETQIYERVLSGKGNQCKYCEGRSSCREGVYIHILNFMHFKIQNKLCKHNFFLQVKNKKVSMMSSGWRKQCCAAVYFTKIQIWSFFLFLIFVNQNFSRFWGINCLLLLARVRETFKNKSKSLFILCDGETFASCVFQLLALAQHKFSYKRTR